MYQLRLIVEIENLGIVPLFLEKNDTQLPTEGVGLGRHPHDGNVWFFWEKVISFEVIGFGDGK